MFSAAELIEALQARHRRRFPLHAERPFGAFPPTWRTWFLSMRERADAVVGAPAADFVAQLGARPPRPRPKAPPPLTRWQALRRMGRQHWDAPPPDQRRTRRIAAAFSGALHLVFVVLLLWLGDVLGDRPPPPPLGNIAAVVAGGKIAPNFVATDVGALGGCPAGSHDNAPFDTDTLGATCKITDSKRVSVVNNSGNLYPIAQKDIGNQVFRGKWRGAATGHL